MRKDCVLLDMFEGLDACWEDDAIGVGASPTASWWEVDGTDMCNDCVDRMSASSPF
jgi:hypothetical protein